MGVLEFRSMTVGKESGRAQALGKGAAAVRLGSCLHEKCSHSKARKRPVRGGIDRGAGQDLCAEAIGSSLCPSWFGGWGVKE